MFAVFAYCYCTTHSDAFATAEAHAPTLLLLDDLDVMCPKEDDELGAANAQAARIAEHLAG
jgi:hypothetical protein